MLDTGSSDWRFSTAEFAPRDRIALWHDVFEQAIVRRTISSLDDVPGEVDVRVQRIGPVGRRALIQRMHLASGFVATRDRSLLRDSSDDIILHLQLSGSRILQQAGREAESGGGAAVVSSNADASRIILPGPTEFISIALPRAGMRALAPNVEDAIARPLPPDSGTLRLLFGYLAMLEGDRSWTDPALGLAVAAHIMDLAAILCGATREAGEIARDRGLRAARLATIKAHIAANLEGDVTAGVVARRHRISPRYLQKLFETDGTTVSRFTLDLRLEQAHRRLCDPRLLTHTIAEIAFGVGFGDISTFNRAFRSKYGMTPGDVRHQAARDD